MNFKFKCPACGQSIAATFDDCGKAAACPTCEEPFTVPFHNEEQTPPCTTPRECSERTSAVPETPVTTSAKDKIKRLAKMSEVLLIPSFVALLVVDILTLCGVISFEPSYEVGSVRNKDEFGLWLGLVNVRMSAKYWPLFITLAVFATSLGSWSYNRRAELTKNLSRKSLCWGLLAMAFTVTTVVINALTFRGFFTSGLDGLSAILSPQGFGVFLLGTSNVYTNFLPIITVSTFTAILLFLLIRSRRLEIRAPGGSYYPQQGELKWWKLAAVGQTVVIVAVGLFLWISTGSKLLASSPHFEVRLVKAGYVSMHYQGSERVNEKITKTSNKVDEETTPTPYLGLWLFSKAISDNADSMSPVIRISGKPAKLAGIGPFFKDGQVLCLSFSGTDVNTINRLEPLKEDQYQEHLFVIELDKTEIPKSGRLDVQVKGLYDLPEFTVQCHLPN